MQNLELVNFTSSMKLPRKTKLPENFELPDKRGFELMERSRFLPCSQSPFINSE